MKKKLRDKIVGLMIGILMIGGSVLPNATVHAEKEAPNNMAQFGSTKYNVPLDKCWTIKFTKPVDKHYLDHVYIVGQDGTSFKTIKVLSKDKKTLYVINEREFKKNTNYTLVLVYIKSTSGETIYPFCVRFKTIK